MSRYVSSAYQNMQPLYLYDLKGGSAQSQPWAPNIWRIRFILNYKRLPYKTIYLSIEDVETQLRAIGAPPTSIRRDRTPAYTLPVLVDSNPTPLPHTYTHGQGSRPAVILSNLNNIAEYLESTYPARPVFPDGSRAMQTLFIHYIQDYFTRPLLQIMIPMSQAQLRHAVADFSGTAPRGFSPSSAPPAVGGAAVVLSGAQLEDAWRQVKAQFDFLGSILEKNSSDPECTVAQGRDLTYADFALCAVLVWVKRVAARDGWAQVRTWGGGRWARLYDRCREYMDEC